MRIFLVVLFSLLMHSSGAQLLMDLIDTSTDVGKSVLSVSQRFDHVRIGGYIQPQFQSTGEKGAKGYAGGDFAANVNNRFMLRRGRIRFDYVRFNKTSRASVQFVFQFDGSERGVFIRDFWGRLFENKYQLFSFVAGMFARPFSYELNLSSSDRESPERGRMSQILMKTERDLGAMISFEPRKQDHPLRFLKIDAGLFNGQGLTAAGDFDSHKDFISRLTIKPYAFNNIELSGGLSFLRGGWKNGTKYVYETTTATNGDKLFTVDSSISNLGRSSPRHYYGADVQFKIKHGWGETEWRAEYWFGTQPGTATSTTNPGTLPNSNGLPLPTFVRHYDGAFFYFLQNIINAKNQLVLKYDWYDPNIKVKKTEIGKTGTNLTSADIKFSTFGFGYAYYFNPQTKIIFYYDLVKNEDTALNTYTTDQKDNVFTCRLQFRF